MEMEDNERLKDKVAIVTGGGKGIGRAIALGFAKEGANLVICGRKVAPLEEVCREARSRGISAVQVKADVSVESEVQNMVQEALRAFGKVDILVNNAGIGGPVDLVTDIAKEAWEEVFNINLTGMFLCSKAVLRHMIERRAGNIINLSSGAGFRGAYLRSLPYSVSKWGVEGFNHALALQMKPYGVCVNALRPGRTDTDFHKDSPPEIRAKLRKPNGVSKLAVFLALQTVETMTGESIDLAEWEKS
jgi:NAD(P)-dependent dehydrogenase (short-subunit alcohol dehydrogenase family)